MPYVSSNTSGDNDSAVRHSPAAMGTEKKSKTPLGRRIRIARKTVKSGSGKEISLTAFAKIIGVTRGAASQWELGVSEPAAENLRNIAVKTGTNYDWLATGRGSMISPTDAREALTERTASARVIGEIGGGGWFETPLSQLPDLPPDFDTTDSDKYEPVPVVRDRKYQEITQFALKVVGPSVNKIIRDGDFAICVPYFEVRDGPRDRDVVAVERKKNGMYQGTIKRLRRIGKEWELHPESHDPKFQDPIRLNENLSGDRDDSDTEITIIGLVIGQYGSVS